MKHIILGKGNLGQALNRAVYHHTNESPITSYRESAEDLSKRIVDSEENWIWVTEGFGSVGECKKDPFGAFDLHVRKTHELIHRFPKSNLVFFSTNYVVPSNDPAAQQHTFELGSEYAVSKAMLENVVRLARNHKKNVWAIRVANLYSKYNPWNSFAGRLLKAKQDGKTITLPMNVMIPTDTDWLADRLMDRFDLLQHFEPIIGMAPIGSVTTHKLGELVLNQELGTGVDTERPMNSTIRDSFWGHTATWYQVWNQAVEYRKALGLSEIPQEYIHTYRGV
jgi:dTDP-4-dehydrorhamnose reductase